MKIIYLHGFNSSSKSRKAQILKKSKLVRSLGIEIVLIDLPNSPKKAILQIEKIIVKNLKKVSLLGSSLGGLYATFLSDKYNLKSVTINPVVPSHLIDMKPLIGEHVNFHNNEKYEFSKEMFNDLLFLKVKKLKNPLNHFCFIKLNDEVIDQKEAIKYFAKGNLNIDYEGSHDYLGFESKLPLILDFLL